MQQATAHINNVQANLNEHQLVERAKQNPAAFSPLYEKYYEPILRFVYQRCSDKETAYDITAHVFLKAMQNLKNYTFKGLPFSSWLYRIARNEVIDHHRQKPHERAVSIDKTGLVNILHETDDSLKEEHIQLILKELKTLSEDEMQIIEMKYFEKRQFREIAEILDITETNAKVRAHRIIEKLRKSLMEKILR
ncbi:MAG TPA: sigma-70 family RNA polymerase sigma factor [Flavobacteriales bacterium]|nr:sigma-70 family RNA polymerase sigma factor [Flavobacteriales bacterium]